MDDLRGITLGGRYVIERELGRGGMATVWQASDALHERPVAIKTLHPDLAGAIAVDRFVRELRLTARLQHPNILPLLDSGALSRPDGTTLPWYAMPCLTGESLRARLEREHQLPIEEALRITGAVGDALETAHRQQVVHRDIKPENIFLAGDHVYVLDFGIAKALGAPDTERLTSTGLMIGTPAYMSPEQSVDGGVDPRSDQYSLATVLYEMLVGEPPFAGSSAQGIIARRLGEPARPLRTVRPTIPAGVERATLRALERTPADRFATVADFLAALGGAEEPPRPRFGRSRRARVAAGLAVLLVAAMAAAWGMATRARAARVQPRDPQVLALYQRGVREYDRRTPAGVADAIVTLRAALARDSSYAPAWSALAKAYTRAHQRDFRVPGVPSERLLELALTAADRSLTLDSMSADAWLTLGVLNHVVDPVDHGPALRAIRRSIALDSMQAPSWHFLAVSLAETGEFDTALAAWRRCVQLAPSYAQGVAFLALAHYWRGNFDSAAVWADSALRIDSNYLLARHTAGLVAVERGDYVRAEAAFEAARRLSSDVEVVNALAGEALSLARSGRTSEARAVLGRARALAAPYDPIPLHTAVYIAQVHVALGERDRALGVLSSFPQPRNAHFQLHLRCDPPFAPLARDASFRALVVSAPERLGQAC